ncbi:MAG: hypothetical protein KBC28_07065 [Alphaproteobacteria bacterium]|jgi:hypothetical protein|nr:hypothetical protein [Alphaproteobacteria bacterium]
MNIFKSFLLASTIIATLSPFSLSAMSSEELSEKIRIARAAPVRVQPEVEAPRGWFSSFRKSAGDAVRWAGDQLRTEGNTKTAAGNLKEMAKDLAAKGISAKVGFSVTSAIFNPIGNGLRKVGQWIKEGEETQTPLRVVLSNLGLNHSAKQADIEQALKTAATAAIRADVDNTAPEFFLEIVKGVNNRGHSTKQIDAFKIYVDAVAREVMQQNATISQTAFEETVRNQSYEMLQYIAPVKATSVPGEKIRLMNQYLNRAFQQEKAKNNFNAIRVAAVAAAA